MKLVHGEILPDFRVVRNAIALANFLPPSRDKIMDLVDVDALSAVLGDRLRHGHCCAKRQEMDQPSSTHTRKRGKKKKKGVEWYEVTKGKSGGVCGAE